MEVKKMTLKEATQYVLDKLSQDTVSKVLGVTRNQVYKYSTGATKSCNNRVVDAFYDNFGILIDMYNTEEEYLRFRKLREEHNDNSDD